MVSKVIIDNRSFSRLVEEDRKLFTNCQENPTIIEDGIKQCGRHIRAMNAALKKATCVGGKQHIAGCAALITGFRAQMKMLRGTVGAGLYKSTNPNRSNYASNRVKWIDQQSAFASRMRTGAIINLAHKDPAAFLQDPRDLFRRRINNMLKKETSVKVNTAFCGEFVVVKAGAEFREFKYMLTKNVPIYRDTDINTWFSNNAVTSILTQLEEIQERDSGWALSSIINSTVNINKFTPQLGSSYIKLPSQIKRKEAYINVKNNDEACFAWAVTSALHPVPHGNNPNRISSYPYYSSVLNLTNISLPMTVKQIPRFESQNKISINVYILEKSNRKSFQVAPTYLTKNKQEKHVNLLLLQDCYDGDEEEDDVITTAPAPKYNYVWIKSLSRLVSTQLSLRHGRKYFCDRCLHYFRTVNNLEKHRADCLKMNECKVRLPEERATVHFKNHHYKESAPFVVYADIECILKSTTSKQAYQEQVLHSIAYYVKCSYDDSLSFYKSYRGADCQQWFTRELQQFAEDVETVFLCPLPMEPLSPADELEFQ